MTKRSKHPFYDDPTAFSKRFPRIEKVSGGTLMASRLGIKEQCYKMGALRITVSAPEDGLQGYFMSIHGRDKYADWDEIVWLRYNLIPDSARMSLILPNLNNYINQDATAYKFVFTMEQTGWALDPMPTCEHCGKPLEIIQASVDGANAAFKCPDHGWHMVIDMSTWNEAHGNGLLAAALPEGK